MPLFGSCIILIVLCGYTGIVAQATTYSIVSTTSTQYIFSGTTTAANPTLLVERGTSVTFTFSSSFSFSASPFWLRSAITASADNSATNAYSGVTNNGASSGSIVLTVATTEPLRTLYYQSGGNAAMFGIISLYGGSTSPIPYTLPPSQSVPALASSNYTILSGDSVDYTFSSLGLDPALYAVRGMSFSITFSQVLSSHPLWIRYSRSTEIDNTNTNAYAYVTNNGATNGSIIISIPTTESSGTIYYQCGFHPSMSGAIYLVDAAPSPASTSPQPAPVGTPKLADSALAVIIVLAVLAAVLLLCAVLGLLYFLCYRHRQERYRQVCVTPVCAIILPHRQIAVLSTTEVALAFMYKLFSLHSSAR